MRKNIYSLLFVSIFFAIEVTAGPIGGSGGSGSGISGLTTGNLPKAASPMILEDSGIAATKGTANNLSVTGGSANNPITIEAIGSDADIGLEFKGKGFGTIGFIGGAMGAYPTVFGGGAENTNGANFLTISYRGGDRNNPLPLQANNQVGEFCMGGYYGTGALDYTCTAGIWAKASENWDADQGGTRIFLFGTKTGGFDFPIVLDFDGDELFLGDGTINTTLRGTAITVTPLTASRAICTDSSKNLTSTCASADLRNSLSDELGTGALLFDGATPTAFVLTNATGLPVSTGITGFGANVATALATPTLANWNAALSDANFATLEANTFTGEQIITSGVITGLTNFGINLANNTSMTGVSLGTITDTTSRPLQITQTWNNAGLTGNVLKIIANVSAANNASNAFEVYGGSGGSSLRFGVRALDGGLTFLNQGLSVIPTDANTLTFFNSSGNFFRSSVDTSRRLGIGVGIEINDGAGGNPVYLFRENNAVLQYGLDSSTAIHQLTKACDGSGTNEDACNMTIAGGRITGNGTIGGNVIIQTAYAGSSGTLQGTLTDRIIVAREKILTDASTNLFEIALATLQTAGGKIDWTIEVSDGTNQQAYTGVTTFAATNKAGVYTTTITQDTNNDAKAVDSGTLTTSWAVAGGTNKVTISVTPSGSLTETTYRISFVITQNSPRVITLL